VSSGDNPRAQRLVIFSGFFAGVMDSGVRPDRLFPGRRVCFASIHSLGDWIQCFPGIGAQRCICHIQHLPLRRS